MSDSHWRLGVVLSMVVLGGCCPYEGRCRESAVHREGEHAYRARKYPGGVRQVRDEPVWTELPLVSVDIRKKGDERRLVVKTRTPTEGWKVRVKALPARDSAEAEFQVVGLAPVAAPARDADGAGVQKEVLLLPGVEYVVVRGSDGSVIIGVD